MKYKLFFLFIIFIPLCYSELECNNDYCVKFTAKPSILASDNNIQILAIENPTSNPITKGYILMPILNQQIIEDIISGGGTAFYQYQKAHSTWYAVLVDVEKEEYYYKDKININITLINEGDKPDQDTTMTTFFIDSNNNTYLSEKQIFFEIPVGCPLGTYNIEKNRCVYFNITEYIPFSTIIKKTYTLPSTILEGQYKFVVIYETSKQPKIEVYDSFFIKKHKYLLFILSSFAIFILLSLIFITKASLKNAKKQL